MRFLKWFLNFNHIVSGLTKGVEGTDCPQLISLCLNLLENVQERVSCLLSLMAVCSLKFHPFLCAH